MNQNININGRVSFVFDKETKRWKISNGGGLQVKLQVKKNARNFYLNIVYISHF